MTGEIKKRRSTPDLFRPHEAIPRSYYIGGVLLGLFIIFGGWSILSYGGFVKPAFFLPTPTEVITAGARMASTGELWEHIWASVSVIMIGWILATVLAIPVGILMGTFSMIEALLEPIMGFVRYLPVSAMIPLLILYIGLGMEEKVAVIFIGTFFQQVLMVADIASHVSDDLLDSAYTLGASRLKVLAVVLVPATLPATMDALRITLGWAWTYLIVAELVAADRGLGIMILESQRGLRTDKIFFGLVVIGLLGFTSDFIFKVLHRRLLPWSPRIR